MFSPESGTKPSPHVPLKCGFKCVDCKRCHIFEDKLKGVTCNANASGNHRILKRAIMCEHCECTSDCLEAFMKESCAGSPTPGPTPRRLDHEAAAKTVPPDSTPQWKRKLEVEAEHVKAQSELTRLLFLKSLQEERIKLQQLHAAKHQRLTKQSGVDNIETQPMLPSEAAVYAKAYEAPNKSAAAAVGNEEKPVCTEAKQRNARKSKAYRRAYKEAQDNGLSAEECGASAMGWKTRASLKGVRGSGGDLNLLPSRLTLYSILNQDTGGLTLFVFQVFFWMALHGGLSAKRSVFFGNVCSMGQLDKGKLTNKERAKRTKNTTTRKYVDKSGKKRFVGDKKALKASQYRPWYFAWCSQ
ncbi:Uncharacterized protein SCF082_LOCUS23921 [Durusdinium trenchii]|uniref:Uncharacterized protein n=1 Tax=Durusdinium trenchii TaxID=1381693 RepID=A0ABP0LQC2_9DINO